MDEADWVSCHLFYHDQLEPMLVELVKPLVDALSADGLSSGCFFLRYWDGGPHLRLRLLATAGSRDEMRQRMVEGGSGFFNRHPAPDRLAPAAYPGWAAKLARLEGLAGFLPRPYPNNSLAFIPYRREHDRYGRGAAMVAVERHFVESSTIALDLILAGLPVGHRTTAALSMLLAAWLCHQPDPGLLAEQLPGAPIGRDATLDRAELARRYEAQRDTIDRIARQMRALALNAAAEPGPAGGSNGSLARWARSVTALGGKLAAAGHPEVFRVIDTCAHLVCNRLGVPLDEENYLRYLAGRAVSSLAAGAQPVLRGVAP